MGTQGTRNEALAYQQLKNLRSQYSHTIDHGAATGDWDDFISLYTEDAVVDYPQETMHGREEIREFSEEIEEYYEYSMHTAQMPMLDVDGDGATGTWYMLVFYIATDGSEGYVVGRYEDEYRRVDDEWKFSRIEAYIDRDSGGFHV